MTAVPDGSETDPLSIQTLNEQYVPRGREQRQALIDPVFEWLGTGRSLERLSIARDEMHLRFQKMEEDILLHFAGHAGGPAYMEKQAAWTMACRRGEFVREVCARMAEDKGGVPTELSEAIRAMDISEDVRVIPDYSKRGIA